MTSARRLITSSLDAAIGVVARSRWRLVHYAVLLLVHESFFTSGTHAGDRDWRLIFYPWADALRLSLLRYHEFPWWNPWSLSGQPLFADPQTAVLMPDTLCIAVFGAVVGLKVVIVLYFFVGYEGSRFLCRELFGPSRFVESISIIPALIAPLAMHFSVGHVVFVTFFFFPWLLALALTWQNSAGRAVAFGFVIGCILLSYIHYVVIIAGTLVIPIVLLGFWRGAAKLETWAKAALVGCMALGMSFARLCLTLDVVRAFPRTETLHYPLSYSLGGVFGTLVDPLQDRNNEIQVAGLGWWELGCYVGVCALFLAYEGFRRNERKFWPLYGAAVLCLVLAWDNRDPWFPSYWLHFVGPYQYMLVITRWRLFGCFFLLLGAVHGLVGLRMRGRARLAGALAVFVVIDLGFAMSYAYRGTFALNEPPFRAATGAPRTVADSEDEAWPDLRANLVSDGAECTLLGYGRHYPKRFHVGSPGYVGDFFGKAPVSVETWTPDRIVLRGTPGDTVTLNVNPSNYWLMNGERLFPTVRPFEIDLPFTVKVPSGGRMELVPRPPHWQGLFLAQGAFAVAAVALFLGITRSTRRAVL
jgi:hypothetical protein